MKKSKKSKPSSRKKSRVKDLTSKKNPRAGLTATTYGRSTNPTVAGNTIGSSLGTDKILNP